MGTNFTGLDGVVCDRNLQYYGERARGGAGLIITEASYIDKTTKVAATGDWFIRRPVYSGVLHYLQMPSEPKERRLVFN